jgi:hypothetical protein
VSTKTEPLYTRIFLDTNTLLKPWPRLPLKIENILTIAIKLGIAVEIPEGVLVELERRWRDRTKEDIETAKDTLKNIGVLVGNGGLPAMIPEWNAIHEGYEKAVKSLLEKWSIRSTAMPAISVSELFTQAAERQFVFQDKGKNFQDAVILHSGIERLAEMGGAGVLISEDNIFQDRLSVCQQYAAAKNVTIAILKIKDAERHLTELLSKTERERIARHKDLARAATLAFLPEFSRVFDRLLERNEKRNADQPGRLVLLPAGHSEFTEVLDVDVLIAESEPPIGSDVKLTASVSGRLFQDVSPPTTPWEKVTMQVSFNALAKYQGDRYEIQKVGSMTYGWPP